MPDASDGSRTAAKGDKPTAAAPESGGAHSSMPVEEFEDELTREMLSLGLDPTWERCLQNALVSSDDEEDAEDWLRRVRRQY